MKSATEGYKNIFGKKRKCWVLYFFLVINNAASKDHKNSNEECVFRYKHDLKSKKTIFVRINSLFSLINIIKTESNNFLSNRM